VFQCLGDKVSIFLGYTDEGSSFVYGYLVSGNPFFPDAINITDDPDKTDLFRVRIGCYLDIVFTSVTISIFLEIILFSLLLQNVSFIF